MPDRSLLILILALLGVSGVAFFSGPTSGPAVPSTPPPSASREAGAVQVCTNDPVYEPLCLFFGVSSVGEAKANWQRRSGSRVVIATVPDPLDSEVGFQFDPRLETVRMAAVSERFEPDRFFLPWRAAPNADQPPSHRTTPGALLFRARSNEESLPTDEKLLLILLVGETPTFGVDQRAMRKAINTVAELQANHLATIVGPTYSGSVESLRQQVAEHSPQTRLEFISIASDHEALGRLAKGGGDPRVATFSDSPKKIVEALRTFARSRTAEDVRIAILHEGDTAFGGAVRGEVRSIPYPLHVSQLWVAHLRDARTLANPTSRFDVSARSALSLLPEAPAHPIDVPPAFFSTAAANNADRILAAQLERLGAEDPDLLGIVGSNVSDIIYLAKLARRHVPNAQLFTIGGDILLTHPQHRGDLHGMWIVSSQPGWERDSRRSLQFASSWEHGEYLALRSAIRRGFVEKPRWSSKASDTRSAPIWIAAVARDGIVPIGGVNGPLPGGWSESPPSEPARAFVVLITAFILFSGVCVARAFGRGASVLSGLRTLAWAGENCASRPRNGLVLALFFAGLALGGAYPTLVWVLAVNEHATNGFARALLVVSLLTTLGLTGVACRFAWRALGATARPTKLVTVTVAVGIAAAALLAAAFDDFESVNRDLWTQRVMQIVSGLSPLIPATFLAAGFAVLCYGWLRRDRLNDGLTHVRHFGAGAEPDRLIARTCEAMPRTGLGVPLLDVARSPTVWAGAGTAGITALLLMRAGGGIGEDGSFGLVRWAVVLAAALSLSAVLIQKVVAARRRRGAGAKGTAVEPKPRERRYTRWSRVFGGVRLIVLIVAFVLAFWSPVRPLVMTMEPRVYAWTVTVTVALLLGGAAYFTAAAFELWQRLRTLLRDLAWGPLSDAFDRLPPQVFRSLGLRWSAEPGDVSALQYDLDQLALIEGASSMAAAGVAAGTAERLRDTLRQEVMASVAGHRPYAHETETQAELSRQAGRVLVSLEAEGLQGPPRGEHTDRGDAEATGASPPEAPPERDHPNIDVVGMVRQQAPSGRRLREEFVAMQSVRFMALVFAQLRNYLLSAITIVLLVLLAVGSYPLRPQALLVRSALIAFAVVMLVTVSLLLQTERNVVLSRIANRSPNRLDFDATFFSQVFTYVVLPVTALLVTQFPALSGPLSNLLSSVGTR